MSYLDFDFPHTKFYDSDLRELIAYVKGLVKAVESIDGWIENHQKEYEEIKKYYDEIISGNFPDEVQAAFAKWMRENALDLIGEMASLVIFNITDDGYFVAYIPDSWEEIVFGTTGLDPVSDIVPEYGHLVLSYEASTRAYE